MSAVVHGARWSGFHPFQACVPIICPSLSYSGYWILSDPMTTSLMKDRAVNKLQRPQSACLLRGLTYHIHVEQVNREIYCHIGSDVAGLILENVWARQRHNLADSITKAAVWRSLQSELENRHTNCCWAVCLILQALRSLRNLLSSILAWHSYKVGSHK
jgi:hypothetical protein